MPAAPARGRRGVLPLLPLGVAALLGLSGCHRDDPPPPRAHYRPPAYHPEDFPDIPLAGMIGYELDPDSTPLALSLAGGEVRRFEVAMIRRPESKDQSPEAILSIYEVELAPAGWILDSPGHWHKGNERLLIEAGRQRGLTTVRFHLRPADADASSRP